MARKYFAWLEPSPYPKGEYHTLREAALSVNREGGEVYTAGEGLVWTYGQPIPEAAPQGWQVAS